MTEHSVPPIREPIAVVGIGCNFPGGVHGPAAYWTLLCDGINAIVEVPADRWNLKAFYSDNPLSPGRMITRFGGFLEDIDKFDCRFFGISPREAARLDPQQRLLLQTTWEAFEDAGIRVDRLGGSPTGVFIGISSGDFSGIQGRSLSSVDGHTGTGSAISMVATRISHRFDLRGPSIAVDTACSSSLVAVDLACRSLWSGQCSIAVAGGVNVILNPETTITLSKAAMLSPDGQCRSFDARANGYVRGEGSGIVILKPLTRARVDGDRIYAVVRASATNQDGHTASLTEPSGDAQEALMRQTCRDAGIPPKSITYVEAHGTGTPVGDPIEAGAVAAVCTREREDICYLGSAKTNIGHLESASGIAGLIKAALSINHRALPPNLHFVTPNPAIDFERLKLRVPTTLTPLPPGDHPIVVGVNSFGFGGTNAHVLLSEAPDRPDPEIGKKAEGTGPFLIPISAASEPGLRDVAAHLAGHIETAEGGLSLPNLAGTLAMRRSHLDVSAVVEVSSLSELHDRLAALSEGDDSIALAAGRRLADPRCVFVFCGQGLQWAGMGRDLMAREPAFQRAFEHVDGLFAKLAGWSIAQAIKDEAAADRFGLTEIAQPLIFAVQVALAALWRAWGVEPSAVCGHSVGEVAAAYVSGALSLPDAVKVIYHRSRLQQRLRGHGRMIAVPIPLADAEMLLQTHDSGIEIAAVNSPTSVTLAGESEQLSVFCSHLCDQNISLTPLNIDYAFHSNQMEPLRDELLESLKDIRARRPKIPMISTVTALPVSNGELNAGYWWRNVRCTVRFSEAMDHVIGEGCRCFLELGPHPAMTGAILECLDSAGQSGNILPSIIRNRSEQTSMRTSLARLYCLGLEPDLQTFLPSSHRFTPLPTYPWQSEIYWHEEEESRDYRFSGSAHPLLGTRQRTPSPTWLTEISVYELPFLADHRLARDTIYPAAAYMEAMFAVARQVIDDGPCELVDVRFAELLNPEQPIFLRTQYLPDRSIVEIHTRRRGEEEWTLNASATVRRCAAPPPAPQGLPVLPDDGIDHEQFYSALKLDGAEFGSSFKGVERLWPTEGEVYFKARLPEKVECGAGAFLFHPVLLDCCLQSARGLLPFDAESGCQAGQIPKHAGLVRFFKAPSRRISCHMRERRADDQTLLVDMDVFDEDGAAVATFDGLRYSRLKLAVSGEGSQTFYRSEWLSRPLAVNDEIATPDGLWIVFSDRGGVAEQVAVSLEQSGARCLRVFSGKRFRRLAPDQFTLRPECPADFEQLLGSVDDHAGDLSGFLHFWSLDCALPMDLTPERLEEAQRLSCISVLHLVQAVLQTEISERELAPMLWLITAGTQVVQHAVEFDGPEIAVAQGALWGLARVIATEVPQLICRIADLDPDGPDVSLLLREISRGNEDSEIAWRAGERFVNRIRPVFGNTLPPRLASPQDDGEAPFFRLEVPTPGTLDRLVLRQIPAPDPKPGEVCLEVHAAGLNFRDIMAALGLLPDEAEETPAWRMLGLECAGIISRVGAGVQSPKLGDRVIVSTRGAFASHVTVAASQIIAIDDKVTFEEAVTIPMAFLTADIALRHFGKIMPGEKVLIHAATGGVGLAAIQLCQAVGAKIFATAGSDEKREYLSSLGIRHVFDSRSLDFADGVMTATGGTGVDLVLNSLSGEFLQRSLETLAPFGRFLEIGKVDIFRDRSIGMASFRRNIQLHCIDVGQILRERPEISLETIDRLQALLAKGSIRPIPTTVFPVSQATQAFKYMAQAKHIGKVVLCMNDVAARVVAPESSRFRFRSDGSYLVTGGTSGFGLNIAEWMVGQGARNLTLASRSGVVGKEAACILERMGKLGAEIQVVCVDVGDITAVQTLIDKIVSTGPPLRGIAHAAVRFDDGVLINLGLERFESVLAPKMAGGWNLHLATRDIPVDFFLLFSSLSADFGAPGQANYAAANSFLNTLARYRRQAGLPALSVDWGAISGRGYVARNQGVASHLGRLGIEAMDTGDALDALDDLIGRDLAEIIVAKIDWDQLAAAVGNRPLHHRLSFLLKSPQQDDEHHRASVLNELMLLEPEEARQFLSNIICKEVADVLKISQAEVDPGRPLDEIGLDSLTTFELKMRFELMGAPKIPISKLRQRQTTDGLVSLVMDLHVNAQKQSGAAAI